MERKTIVGLEVHTQLHTDSKLFCGCPTSAKKESWVKGYLESKGALFEYVEHEYVTRPVNSARARNVKVSQIAKALVYISDSSPVLFVLSGDRKLNDTKAQAFLNSASLRMATPGEVKTFTGCVVGLVPPTLEGIRKIVDKRLLDNELLSFNAGIPVAGIKIRKDELLRILDNYEIGEISSDELISEKPVAETPDVSFSSDEDQPNSRVCEICLGFPGSKPSLNKKVLDYGLKIAMALNCRINPEFFFSRKTYFYPDLAKDFQITQYEIPVGVDGYVELDSGKKIRIRRVHLEEDPASLVHGSGISSSQSCLIDYNRSGVPLAEIVTEPDMSSAAEAREFLNKLLNLIQYLEVFVLGEDILKCDSNISYEGSERVEIKNVSGFRNVEKALISEAARQKKLLDQGEKIGRETRGFNEQDFSTYLMRTKETEDDYGYIFEPDLSRIEVSDAWLSGIRKSMPELPEQKAKRFVSSYGISDYEAKVLCSEYAISKFYEAVVKKAEPKLSAKFITRELLGILNYNDLTLQDSGMKPEAIADLLVLLAQGKVSEKNAKQSLIKYALEKIEPKQFLEKENLLIDSSSGDLEKVVDTILSKNPEALKELKSGNKKSLNFLIGLAMRELKGKAEAKKLQELIGKRASL